IRRMTGAKKFDEMMDRFGRQHAGKTATTGEFIDAAKAVYMTKSDQPAGDEKVFKELRDRWINDTGLPSGDGPTWSIDDFRHEPDRALIVYGTLRDKIPQREAAEFLQYEIARRYMNYTVPIKADNEVTSHDLETRHLLLIGRPSTNSVTAKYADAF